MNYANNERPRPPGQWRSIHYGQGRKGDPSSGQFRDRDVITPVRPGWRRAFPGSVWRSGWSKRAISGAPHIEKVTSTDFDGMFEVNVRGRCSSPTSPSRRTLTGGRIINITSLIHLRAAQSLELALRDDEARHQGRAPSAPGQAG